ncbi:hypothetical protein B649_08550 [Candidatus Sulfuricurvum sp. RIFRC-1]|uniref:HepT-like ribonuclease domain-containing protein n=1 Tax=Candidatus Sulfuricurvum sp. RIFRC-1 TaxID=1249480 RepID=UPI0002996E79|nr:DUF86 domain-containing protein [Candidatus Sulfuricurvum sp. RIFRC-1]AFV98022.1 hypothetical protein B649_08550 [Candidatus Sulfuricurvum sp. RIFRC-1]
MSKRDEKLFINDIKESVDAILEYVEGMSFDEFITDRKTYSAVIREFEIIGEASKHLSNELLEKYYDVDWRDIKDFRNLLIHEYFGVDFEIVWNTLHQDLPSLKSVIEEMSKEQPND